MPLKTEKRGKAPVEGKHENERAGAERKVN